MLPVVHRALGGRGRRSAPLPEEGRLLWGRWRDLRHRPPRVCSESDERDAWSGTHRVVPPRFTIAHQRCSGECVRAAGSKSCKPPTRNCSPGGRNRFWRPASTVVRRANRSESSIHPEFPSGGLGSVPHNSARSVEGAASYWAWPSLRPQDDGGTAEKDHRA